MSEQDTTYDPRKLDDYLLGRLSSEESDALEAELLHDRRLFDLAEAAEGDLVDRYVRGELTPDDRKRFERHLLPSERIRERLATARALRSLTDGLRAPRIAPGERRAAGMAWAAALIAAIAAGALGFEVGRLHDQLDDLAPPAGAVEVHVAEAERHSETEARPVTPAPPPAPAADGRSEVLDTHRERLEQVERELSAARERIASLERAPARDPHSASPQAGSDALSTATVFLTLGTRSTGEEQRLDLSEAERAELLIELGRRRPSGKVLATVTRGDDVIWRELDVDVVSDAGESMARLYLPRQALLDGPHRVELVAISEEEGDEDRRIGTYDFSVER